jgi:Tfp pilus assembly PilM family ATPase
MPLSIEIRSKQMHVVQTVVTKNKIHYKKTCLVPLEEGWIDSKGIKDQAAVSFALSKALEENGIKEKKCTLCINNSSVIYRELTIPKVDDKRISFVVRSEMIATLDLTHDFIIDYIILDETTEEHKTHIRVLAVAIAEKALASYVELCNKNQLKVEAVDTATTSVIKLVSKSDIFDGANPIIVADVESDIMKLYLFENKKYILTRNNRLPDVDPKNRVEWIGEVEDNINKMMQYQYTRPSHIGIQRIAIFGDHPLINNIQSAVQESLSVETLLYPKPEFLSGREDSFLPYLNAIGAALRK